MNAEMQMGAYEGVVNGLKALDKRQGFRGPTRYLAENEVDEFCKQVEEGIDAASLKVGGTFQGVVTRVNPATGELAVRVGERTGMLSRKNMAWAGKVHLVDSFRNRRGKKEKRSAWVRLSRFPC